jgi:ATP-dependent Clp protease ATP-binding subunit ClpC
LFAGPTGTGKTEIAKTLAEFLFGSPERMIRLDRLQGLLF